MTRPRPIRASFFLWLAVPALLWLAVQLVGLPHPIWSYEWTGTGPYGEFRSRRYTRCTYVGPYGPITEIPRDGTCGWVRFAGPGGR
ncbi:hypothetical protein HNR00_003411 [Methylorubrum rhodinum]|uniref:Uncharacterized protein n=1 Tax=Methylorubrum rhodinum TaxID=29428 RepID=A0A840ZNP9_9HYPH|nr:hypothetical protein [Methylorubrum rhodinum]MBB5758688.1 hypothetical protein [Methylorubrum rhodinum]